MNIQEIGLTNFRGYESFNLKLHPQFNLLIGDNGSGKTTILEALAVAAGSFFLGIKNAETRLIRNEDIRLIHTMEGSVEYSDLTVIESKGIVGDEQMGWLRERNGISGKTSYLKARAIREKAETINAELKKGNGKGEAVSLPLIAYYPTGRLWLEGRENRTTDKKEKISLPSRYRGYKNALQSRSTFQIMLAWFKGKFQALIVKNEPSFQLEAVRKVIVENIPGCKNVYWEFDPDKLNTLMISFQDGAVLPFAYLSDGYRNLLALFADLAYRAVTLNPQFKENAARQTEGIVLIDELDLHLHPNWQQGIIHQLKKTFPKIQFVATSHSPFLIQETADGELFRLENPDRVSISGGEQYSLEDISEFLQNHKDPQWSSKKKSMYDSAKRYFDLLEQLTPDKPANQLNTIREQLNLIGKPWSDNLAYIAFLEQKRLLKEHFLNPSGQNESR